MLSRRLIVKVVRGKAVFLVGCGKRWAFFLGVFSAWLSPALALSSVPVVLP